MTRAPAKESGSGRSGPCVAGSDKKLNETDGEVLVSPGEDLVVREATGEARVVDPIDDAAGDMAGDAAGDGPVTIPERFGDLGLRE